jgi:hypothetical protein
MPSAGLVYNLVSPRRGGASPHSHPFRTRASQNERRLDKQAGEVFGGLLGPRLASPRRLGRSARGARGQPGWAIAIARPSGRSTRSTGRRTELRGARRRGCRGRMAAATSAAAAPRVRPGLCQSKVSAHGTRHAPRALMSLLSSCAVSELWLILCFVRLLQTTPADTDRTPRAPRWSPTNRSAAWRDGSPASSSEGTLPSTASTSRGTRRAREAGRLRPRCARTATTPSSPTTSSACTAPARLPRRCFAARVHPVRLFNANNVLHTVFRGRTWSSSPTARRDSSAAGRPEDRPRSTTRVEALWCRRRKIQSPAPASRPPPRGGGEPTRCSPSPPPRPRRTRARRVMSTPAAPTASCASPAPPRGRPIRRQDSSSSWTWRT